MLVVLLTHYWAKGRHPQRIFHPFLTKNKCLTQELCKMLVFLFVLKISAKDYFRPLHKVPIMPVAGMTSVFKA